MEYKTRRSEYEYRTHSHNGDIPNHYDKYSSNHSERSYNSLPAHTKYGFSYTGSAVPPRMREGRSPSRQSDHSFSGYSPRPSSQYSDTSSSILNGHSSARSSLRSSSYTPTHSRSPQSDRYSYETSTRTSSSLDRGTGSFRDLDAARDRDSHSPYRAPSIHDRAPSSLHGNSTRSEDGYSGSHHREKWSSRYSYDDRRSHNSDEDTLTKRYNGVASNFDNGGLNHHNQMSSSETLNGSSKYNLDGHEYKVKDEVNKERFDNQRTDFWSDGFKYGYVGPDSDTSRRLSDYSYRGSKSYSTFPRSYKYEEDRSQQSSYKASSDDSKYHTYDGSSSSKVNGDPAFYASEKDSGLHTGWFRNHQYGPLLSKEANLDDLREEKETIPFSPLGIEHFEDSNYRSSSKVTHRKSGQDEDRRYRGMSLDRESRDRRLEEKQLMRSVSQDRDLGYYSLRNEKAFSPPEKFHRTLSEGRRYHSMTNLDSTQSTKRVSRSRTKKSRHSGLNAVKDLGIKPTLSAVELSKPDVNELQVMALASSMRKVKSKKAEPPKPVKIEWGKCARFSDLDMEGADRSDEVFQNTKGMVTHVGLTNVPIVMKIHIVSDRAIAEDISAQVDAPGESVPISLKKISDELVEASVLPLNEGIHAVSVRCRGDLIDGCPIRIMVMADQSSFPENVRVGKITTAVVGEELQFQVDVSEAGKGELTVSISNGRHELPVRLEQNGSMFTIFTIADAVGDYFVNILWDRTPVTDEPAKLRVFAPNLVKAHGEGLVKGREDTPASFVVDPREAGFAELKVSAEGPNSMAKVTITANSDKTYNVTYVPTEVGTFNIKITYGGRNIFGAPFQAKITDPRKVRFAGFPTAKNDYGTMDLFIKQTYRIELETEDAGPGELRAELETDNAILPLQVDHLNEFKHTVLFTPPKEGRCIIRVKWAGSDIKGSPFEGYAREKELPVDHTQVVVKGEGLIKGKVYVPAEFIIDGSRAGAGVPTVSITGTSEDVDVKIDRLGSLENIYKVTFVPERAGTHIIYVAWSDKQIPNSPFKVNVQASPHAERVRASSIAMSGVIAGQTCEIIIDTSAAADGELTAKCFGPTKQADVHIAEKGEGMYSLWITPREPGNHIIEVRYGGEHIQGSPFPLKVALPPDASKVIARGPGLNHGILDDYNGRFICETKGAGAGQLKVRVHGPKGAFKVQMKRSSKKDRTIDVRYNPSEMGEYNIQVKWSDQHVPGSPFTINIVETEEELREVKKKHPIDSKYTSLTQPGWQEDL